MNKDRKNRTSNVLEKLRDYSDKVLELKDELECIKDEEDDAMMNVPENLQGSERYEAMENAVDALDSAIDSLEEICDNITDVADELDNMLEECL